MMVDDIRSFMLEIGLPFVIVCAVLFGLGYGLISWQCSSHAAVTGYQTKMAGGACYVREDDRWMRWDEYKLRFATKGAS